MWKTATAGQNLGPVSRAEPGRPLVLVPTMEGSWVEGAQASMYYFAIPCNFKRKS